MMETGQKIAMVWIPTTITIGLTLADVKEVVVIVSAVVATGYTLWRWLRDIKDK